jgi:hypothetical protein
VSDQLIHTRQWAVAENGIYFIPRKETHRPLLKFFSFAAGRTTQIARLEKDDINGVRSGMAISPDGRWLLFALTEHESGDIMMVENFR